MDQINSSGPAAHISGEKLKEEMRSVALEFMRL